MKSKINLLTIVLKDEEVNDFNEIIKMALGFDVKFDSMTTSQKALALKLESISYEKDLDESWKK